jgi:hypothetical protein
MIDFLVVYNKTKLRLKSFITFERLKSYTLIFFLKIKLKIKN